MKRFHPPAIASSLFLTLSSYLLITNQATTFAFAQTDNNNNNNNRCSNNPTLNQQYQCISASCGTTTVSDCLECNGYLNTDPKHNLCFNRKLFNTHKLKDPDNHYPYLINDIIGIIIWFIAAGVATACGVGGGGIYVPLGIILLRFESKPATGLSQASIFGASLGGLILNIRNKHPDEKIRDLIGRRDDDGKVIPYDLNLSSDQVKMDEQAYLDAGSYVNNNNDDDDDDDEDGTRVMKKREFYTRPLIDYDMALFLAPMEMAGAVLGVIIQKLLPNWLFLSLAGIILGLTSFKTYQKFFTAYAKDKENREKRRMTNERRRMNDNNNNNNGGIGNDENNIITSDTGGNDDIFEQTPSSHIIDEILGNDLDSSNNNDLHDRKQKSNHGVDDHHEQNDAENFIEETDSATEVDHIEQQQQQEEELHFEIPDYNNEEHDDPIKLERRREMLKEDMRQYPVEKLVMLLILWIGLALITFLKGGKGVDSLIGITCSSPWYMVLIASQFLWTLGFAALFGYKLVKRHEEKVECDYPFHTNDVLWDLPKLQFYAFFTFIAGVVAGLIGIGGGMVLGPLMLILGVHPRVSSATTATMIVLTSSSVAIMFVTSGLVPWEYVAMFFCVCLLGAYIGKKYIDRYVKKTGMSSILIGILATIIAFATIGCFVIVILNLSEANWCFDGFKPFCVDKDEDKNDGIECGGLAQSLVFLEGIGADYSFNTTTNIDKILRSMP